jgi:Zn finger protein HypA/HybF involved in hydrogenase expression
MSIVKRVQSFLGKQEEQPQEPTKTETQLYWCEACKNTYIKKTMDACPRCDSSVETVSSEYELEYL